jgi:pyruvate,water dikinase
MRFRSSTNSEDLDGFPCAGCYESHTGDPADWVDVLDAIRETWASIWLFRTFEERAYNGIDHTSVVMALLVHHNFPDEEANGVALTSNPFDPSGLQPGFYVNVQYGGDRGGRAPAGRHLERSDTSTCSLSPGSPSVICRTPTSSRPARRC